VMWPEELALHQEITGSHILHVLMKRSESFTSLSDRGFFTYDWSDVHRTRSEEMKVYERMSSPTKPLRVEQLDTDAWPALSEIGVVCGSFSESSEILVYGVRPN